MYADRTACVDFLENVFKVRGTKTRLLCNLGISFTVFKFGLRLVTL